jgi:hypothetical protein
MSPLVNFLHKNFVGGGGVGSTSRIGRVTKNLQTVFLSNQIWNQWWNEIWNLNMFDAQNKMLEGKYEINTDLPHGEGS